jgi:hypothetical protein
MPHTQPEIEGLDKLKKLPSSLQNPFEELNSLLAEVSKGLDDTPAAQRKKTLLGLQQALAELEKRTKFVNIPNAERCRVLANRLGATETATDDPNLFKLQFNERFPIGLTHCKLYFPPTDVSARQIEMYLRRDKTAFHTVIILSLEPAQQLELRPYGEDATTLWVVPNFNELAALLLSKEPIAVFITQLAAQLKISLLSPYKTSGAVQTDMMFFGRTQQLAHILGRTPTSYLLIGGRHLGKSSLLKHIERHYQDDPNVKCHYMVLSDHNLQSHLANALNLPVDTHLSVLLENLANVPDGQRRLLLIDEADLFICDEEKNNYPTLSQFRRLTEERRCYFILAGFWYLHEAMLNYYSPIKNFAEPLFVGELEQEACQQLATQPMEMLGIDYASNELVEQILEQTGHQPNLIATVCDHMLKNLATGQRMLAQENVTQALQSKEIEKQLMGFGGLTRDKQAARLDRLIIYTTVDKRIVFQQGVMEFVKSLYDALSKQEGFTLAELMDSLDQCNCSYTAEQLRQSMNRLELAFILRREGEHYRYCVPLFQHMLKEQGVAALLRAEGVSEKCK